jgi:hypothetical protein
MLNQNEVKLAASFTGRNIPLDAGIIGWFAFYAAFISLFILTFSCITR